MTPNDAPTGAATPHDVAPFANSHAWPPTYVSPPTLTVDQEGRAPCPSTLEWEEFTPPPNSYDRLQAHVRRTGARHLALSIGLIALSSLLGLLVVAGLLLVMGGQIFAGFCACTVGTLAVIPFFAWVRLRGKSQIAFGPQVFAYMPTNAAADRSGLFYTVNIQGFGYARVLGIRSWQTVAIFVDGTTMMLRLPTHSKDEARWIARRLNAELGKMQRECDAR